MAPNLTKEPVAHAGATGTDTVTVGCKWPSGLVLALYGEQEVSEQTAAGPRSTKVFPKLREYTVKGPAREKGKLANAPISGGYALTRGVPRDFMEKWLEVNAENPLVKNRIVIIGASPRRASDMAREMAEVRSGAEPLNPNGKDYRIPKPVRPEAGKIEADSDASMDFEEVEG
jgi:hypothetical protein